MVRSRLRQPRESLAISVIIPAFNAETHIARTMESLRRQTMDDFEVIVVDDGSSDGTVEVVAKYVGRVGRTVRIISQNRCGVSAARNVGLRNAEGLYVFWIDSDDTIEPSCLEKLYAEVRRHSADVVFCGSDYVDSSGLILLPYSRRYGYPKGVVDGRSAMKGMIDGKWWMRIGSALYWKQMLYNNALAYTVGCTGGEDTEFILKVLFRSTSVSSVPESLCKFYRRPRSARLDPMTIRRRATDDIAAWTRLITYVRSSTSEQALVQVLDDYMVVNVLPSAVATLAASGMNLPEICKVIDVNSLSRAVIRKRYRLRKSLIDSVHVFARNVLLALSPDFYCRVARARGLTY